MPKDTPISRIMQTGLLTCKRNTPLCDAAARMAERRCSSILVVEDSQVVGIWTERDSLQLDFDDPQSTLTPIDEVMNHSVATLPQSVLVNEVTEYFNSQKLHHLLVVDNAGAPCGIVTQTDIALNQGIELYLKLREVSTAMCKAPLVLAGDLPLSQAAKRMSSSHHTTSIVECDNGELGILTERDMVRFVAQHPGNSSINQLASRPLITVYQDDTLISARDLLIEKQIRHLGVLDAQGRTTGLLSFQDILTSANYDYFKDLNKKLEQRNKALTQSKNNLQLAESVIHSSLEGVIITDANKKIEFVNPAFVQMAGYTLEEIAGHTPSILSSGCHPDAFYRQMWKSIEIYHHWRGEIWNRRKDGSLYLQLLTINAIHDESGNVKNYVALLSDITRIRENEEKVRHLAYYDPLTQLANRRLAEERIALGISHTQSNNKRLAVIFIDLDSFKQVNDSLGHAIGDELLVRVSQRLHAKTHADDTLARLGGDEFLLLKNNIMSIDEATQEAKELIELISSPFDLHGHSLRIGCSIGVSIYPDDASNPEALIHCADLAMYQAKKEGRNTYRLFHPKNHQRSYDWLLLETALRNTAETGEGLNVEYQPLVNLSDGKIYGAEVLMRWRHPEFGIIPPNDFIPLAERSGLIFLLGEKLLHIVAQQLSQWRSQNLILPKIFVNLSFRQFWQEEFVKQVQNIYKDYDLSPGQINFELTESVLMDRHQEAAHALEALRHLGCKLAIDDFGTGYSSLSYLETLPVNIIKIDKSFIDKLEKSRVNAAILTAVTHMARELDLSVVAEGVETEEQLKALSKYPIDLIQGFLTGRPVSAKTFTQSYLELEKSHR